MKETFINHEMDKEDEILLCCTIFSFSQQTQIGTIAQSFYITYKPSLPKIIDNCFMYFGIRVLVLGVEKIH